MSDARARDDHHSPTGGSHSERSSRRERSRERSPFGAPSAVLPAPPWAMDHDEERSLSLGTEVSASVPPPSPLTGCYLLAVIGEPHTHEHKEIILQRLVKGTSISSRLCSATLLKCLPVKLTAFRELFEIQMQLDGLRLRHYSH
ncbi:hypothetical protein O0L34_g12897 [Tuta absoluta]|nr:hypothetical protein O0L34_g12897 [Tuta absoluta]